MVDRCLFPVCNLQTIDGEMMALAFSVTEGSASYIGLSTYSFQDAKPLITVSPCFDRH